jgi:hypothetical protein
VTREGPRYAARAMTEGALGRSAQDRKVVHDLLDPRLEAVRGGGPANDSSAKIGNPLATRDSGRDQRSHDEPGLIRKMDCRRPAEPGVVGVR